jgi:hypothetical protein
MKRYISAILIPCLLLQLCGCHSTKYLSSEELRHNYSYYPLTIVTKDGREFVIKKNLTVDEIEKDSTKIYCSDFYWLDDSSILSTNSVGLTNNMDSAGNNIKVLKIEKTVISKDLVNRIITIDYNDLTIWNIFLVILVSAIIVVGTFALLFSQSL